MESRVKFFDWSIGDTVAAAFKEIYYYGGIQSSSLGKHGWRRWMTREAVLTAQFAGTLAAFPSEWLSEAMHRFLPSADLAVAYRVVRYEIAPNVLEPDVLLLGDRSLLMIEAKTAMRGRGSHKLPPWQIMHYALLPIFRREQRNITLPDDFLLLLLFPGDLSDWLTKAERWVTDIDVRTGRVTIDSERVVRLAEAHGKLRRPREELRNEIASMPVFYRTWKQLAEVFQMVLAARKDEVYHAHWARLVSEVAVLSDRAATSPE